MKVEQALEVLEAGASMTAKISEQDLADALTELANILRPYSQLEVQLLVRRVAKLREEKVEGVGPT